MEADVVADHDQQRFVGELERQVHLPGEVTAADHPRDDR
jgi:hypothetical protein